MTNLTRFYLLLVLNCVLRTNLCLAHDLGSVADLYRGLPENVVSILRDRDKVRTTTRVRAYEAAAGQSQDEDRQNILSQFSIGDMGPESFEQIYVKGTLWPPMHQFRVCFFDGSVQARQHALDVFSAITQRTGGLSVDRTDRNCPDQRADIQVKFDDLRCFSFYGRDSLTVIASDKSLPTMGLCRLFGPTWDADADGVIRHEFMHALGAAHEHQHPSSKCRLEINLDAFRDPPFFDSDRVKNEKAIQVNIKEITQTYSEKDLLVFPYDPQSIMHYKLDGRFFRDSTSATCELLRSNNVLSDRDWEFLARMYPP